MPSLPAAWATDEPHDALWLEQLLNAAASVSSVGFGIHITVFPICTYHLWRSSLKTTRFPWLKQLYIIVLLILAAITTGSNVNFNELAWINNRNYPGGPLAFIQEQQALPVSNIGNSALTIMTFMVDSLLIYRCYIVWGSNYYVVILPIFMFIASTAMSILQTIAASKPGSAIWAANTVRFGLPFYALTMSLNMFVTAIIITRLLIARQRIRATMGPNHGSMYTSIAAMLVESALPSGLVSLVLIVLYAQGNKAQIVFFELLPQVQAITPQLIFIRVLRGRGWSKQTMTQTTAARNNTEIRFAVSREGPVMTGHRPPEASTLGPGGLMEARARPISNSVRLGLKPTGQRGTWTCQGTIRAICTGEPKESRYPRG